MTRIGTDDETNKTTQLGDDTSGTDCWSNLGRVTNPGTQTITYVGRI